jgi:hypothetical protein
MCVTGRLPPQNCYLVHRNTYPAAAAATAATAAAAAAAAAECQQHTPVSRLTPTTLLDAPQVDGNYAGEIVHSSTLDTMPRMPALWSSSSDANGCGKSGTTPSRAGDGSDAEKQKGREFDKLPASRPTVLPTGNR